MIINTDSIWDEIKAADPTIIGSALSIGADGSLGNLNTLTQAQQTTVASVIAAHDPLKESAVQTRIDTFMADSSRADLITRLATATPAQIDTWLQNNVTTLAQARTVLGAIIKVIALNFAR